MTSSNRTYTPRYCLSTFVSSIFSDFLPRFDDTVLHLEQACTNCTQQDFENWVMGLFSATDAMHSFGLGNPSLDWVNNTLLPLYVNEASKLGPPAAVTTHAVYLITHDPIFISSDSGQRCLCIWIPF